MQCLALEVISVFAVMEFYGTAIYTLLACILKRPGARQYASLTFSLICKSFVCPCWTLSPPASFPCAPGKLLFLVKALNLIS